MQVGRDGDDLCWWSLMDMTESGVLHDLLHRAKFLYEMERTNQCIFGQRERERERDTHRHPGHGELG